jgi:glycosyltransferase involved in cell wall biosynthesis
MIGRSGETGSLISIVLLSYNHEAFIEEAIDGVFSQTYAPLEIIILDDCSRDKTADVIERTIAKKYHSPPGCFVRNAANGGSHAAFKAGLNLATGDFIIFTCGDDVMLPNMAKQMAEVWHREGVSLVTANVAYIDENSRPLNRTFRDEAKPADDSFEALARDGSNACCFGAAMGFERDIYRTFGWPPMHLSTHDIMLPFYAYLHKGARFISTPLLKYRVHGNNASLSLAAEKLAGAERCKVEESIYLGHLAHAVFMEEELVRLCGEAPERYGVVARRIVPLLNIQMAEMSKKLIRSRRARGLSGSSPPSSS